MNIIPYVDISDSGVDTDLYLDDSDSTSKVMFKPYDQTLV